MKALALLCVSLSGFAPLQCGGESDEAMRHYETPAEALYGLASRFRAQGDGKAWRATLQYLVERYPSSRFAVRAKDDLEREPGAP